MRTELVKTFFIIFSYIYNMIRKYQKIIIITAVIYLIFIWPNFTKQINYRQVSEQLNQVDQSNSDITNTQSEQTDDSVDTNKSSLNEEEDKIVIDLRGAVANPGIYHLATGSRMYELIEQAGGFVDANLECINQAQVLSDESLIVIPSTNDNCASTTEDEQNKSLNGSGEGTININTATNDELSTLPGIGPTKAQDIIDYREEKGRFNSIDELTNVTGIGDSTLANISEEISV